MFVVYLFFSKDYSDFFDLEIDPDMDKMGRWALRSLGVSFQCTRQSELFSAIKKHFPVSSCKRYSPDKIVLILFGIIEYFSVKVSRSRFGKDEYTLREHLIKTYIHEADAEKPDIPKPLTIDEAIALARKSRSSTYEVSINVEHARVLSLEVFHNLFFY